MDPQILGLRGLVAEQAEAIEEIPAAKDLLRKKKKKKTLFLVPY